MIYNLDKKLERKIISLARRCGVKKLILFGSRARGDNRERSDIDLAISGGNVDDFTVAVEELETLLELDVVNLDEKLAADFQAEIDRDGIVLFEEVPEAVRKYEYFCKALNNLSEVEKKAPPYSVLELTGIVGLFEICFELSWKALREVLLIHGVIEASTGSPREIIKAGYKFHFLSDEETWLDMFKRRNEAIHIYNEELAVKLVALIFDEYIAAFVNLREEMQRRLETTA